MNHQLTIEERAKRREQFRKALAKIPISDADSYDRDCRLLNFSTVVVVCSLLAFLGWAGCKARHSPLLHDHDQPERLRAMVGEEEW